MDISEQKLQQSQYPCQPPSSSHDPSQSQSYEAYYAYHHHQQQYYDPSSYPHQQYYDYSSTQSYPPPTQIHHPPEHQPAAAMAALSQLSQFAGEMGAPEKVGMMYNPHSHLHLHHYPQHYPMEHGHVSIQPGGSGGGRRGVGPFRGGGRRGGGGRGRGRGRGGGRKSHQLAPNTQPTPAALPTPAPPAPVLPVAWCDICRVECNSLEILEQHKNGKRHKKTAQKFEEIQKQQKLLAEYQAKFIPNAVLPSAVTENAAEVVEAKKVAAEPEIIPMAAVFSTQLGEPAKASATEDNNAAGFSSQVGEQAKACATNDDNAQVDGASKLHNAEMTGEQNSESKGMDAEGSTGPRGPNGYNRFNSKRGGGTKRKMTKYGRGGKRLKNYGPMMRRVPERPRVCTLCNVMCDSLVVFDTHIAGKKHISKIKRCQGQGAVYGPITVYIPPNQPSAYPTRGQEPLFYGLKSHEMIHQTTYMGMSGLQTEDHALHQAVQNSNAEGGVSEEQAMQRLETNGGKEVAIMDNTDPQDPANAPLVFESKESNLSTVVADNSESDGAFKVEQATTTIEGLNKAVESSIQ